MLKFFIYPLLHGGNECHGPGIGPQLYSRAPGTSRASSPDTRINKANKHYYSVLLLTISLKYRFTNIERFFALIYAIEKPQEKKNFKSLY
jgi:hypothetical protein